MDANLKEVILKRINRVSSNLVKNGMTFNFAETKEDVISIVSGLINKGDVIASGGSMTLKQCGVIDFIKSSSDYKYLDREMVAADEIEQLYRASFSADVYFSSSNAITENGELYNVDGNSNRIAAIAYGPKKVIIVAGYNKIVKNLDEAIVRVKSIAAPANCNRLDCATYCYEKGECVSLANGKYSDMTSGCNMDARICCNYLVSAHQRHKDRINVIIVGEELGY